LLNYHKCFSKRDYYAIPVSMSSYSSTSCGENAASRLLNLLLVDMMNSFICASCENEKPCCS